MFIYKRATIYNTIHYNYRFTRQCWYLNLCFFSDQMCNSNWTRSSLTKAVQKYHVTKYKWSALDGTVYHKLRRAAVLIPLFICNGAIHVWLTKRSNSVGTDKGHVSFPGGMKDAVDKDEVDTCLREADEEIGIKANQVEVIAQLYPRLNGRKTLITPVVGIVDGNFRPTPNDEVAVAFHLPFDRFLMNHQHSSQSYTHRGVSSNVLFFHDEIDGEIIATWGLTAAMCTELAVAVFQRETQFDYSSDGKLTPDDPYKIHTRYLNAYEKEQSSKL